MLVLSRKKDESVIIGGQGGLPVVDVKIVEIRGDKVRLGIQASKEVPVHREEVWAAIQREHGSAGQSQTQTL